jgi:hypothetical protein
MSKQQPEFANGLRDDRDAPSGDADPHGVTPLSTLS